MTCVDLDNLSEKMKKGDSSDVYGIIVKDTDNVAYTLESSNWVGTLVVRETLSGANIISKALTKSGDNTMFWASLEPDDSATLEIQEYYMTIQVQNLSLTIPFRKEIQIKLDILEEGA